MISKWNHEEKLVVKQSKCMFTWIKALLLQLMKKAAFGNATIKIRIVFDIKSTPFLNISTPLFFEYKFRVIAQDMRNSVCWQRGVYSGKVKNIRSGDLISTFTENHLNLPKFRMTPKVLSAKYIYLVYVKVGGGGGLDVFGLSVVWKRGRSDVGSSYL